MVKVIIFYLICCISLISLCLIVDGLNDIFILQMMIWAIIIIISPINTLCAGLLYISNINKTILSNVFYSVIYSIAPFVIFIVLNLSHINIELEHFVLLFILQNILIIYFSKKKIINDFFRKHIKGTK